jgi:hypothetical protein
MGAIGIGKGSLPDLHTALAGDIGRLAAGD